MLGIAMASKVPNGHMLPCMYDESAKPLQRHASFISPVHRPFDITVHIIVLILSNIAQKASRISHGSLPAEHSFYSGQCPLWKWEACNNTLDVKSTQ
jgi:hypothetical protein